MVTGIEIAGLVLGAFPLAIEAIKLYASGTRSIANGRKYRQVLEGFCRDLALEHGIFRNMLYSLLEDISPDIELENLMENTGGALWKSQHFESILAHRLRKTSIGLFLSTASELEMTLKQLIEKYREPTPAEDSIKTKLNRVRLAIFDESRKENMARIHKLNEDLRRLIYGSNTDSLSLPFKPPPSAAKHYTQIRTHAAVIYAALQHNFLTQPCGCTMHHCANLQLQMRRVETRQKYTDSQRCRFKFVFTLEPPVQQATTSPSTWCELDLEYLESETTPEPENLQILSTPRKNTDDLGKRSSDFFKNIGSSFSSKKRRSSGTPSPRRNTKRSSLPTVPHTKSVSFNLPEDNPVPVPPTGQIPAFSEDSEIIEDLCGTLANLKFSTFECLGFLLDNNQRKHFLWRPRHSEYTEKPSGQTISLGFLLSNSSQFSPPSRKQRLQLGLQLASSVMQLHDTAWLHEFWGKDDIFFPLVTEGCPKPLFTKPLVRQVFAQTSQAATDMNSMSVIQCNKTLFSLGVILIEVCFWKRIEDMQTPNESSVRGFNTKISELMSANRLVDKLLYDDAGERYGDAVRRCIKGLDHREKELEKDGFKNEVYEKVVYPLEENLKAFCGLTELPETL